MAVKAGTAVTDWSGLFFPDQPELALSTFLLEILLPDFAVRDRPDRNRPPQIQASRRLPGAQARRALSHQRNPLHLLSPAQILDDCAAQGH
jgi:hypothetical protein